MEIIRKTQTSDPHAYIPELKGLYRAGRITRREFLRTGVNQLLEIDPNNLRILYQGVADADREGVTYGKIPWKLGLLQAR